MQYMSDVLSATESPKKTKAKAGKVASMYYCLWKCIFYCLLYSVYCL